MQCILSVDDISNENKNGTDEGSEKVNSPSTGLNPQVEDPPKRGRGRPKKVKVDSPSVNLDQRTNADETNDEVKPEVNSLSAHSQNSNEVAAKGDIPDETQVQPRDEASPHNINATVIVDASEVSKNDKEVDDAVESPPIADVPHADKVEQHTIITDVEDQEQCMVAELQSTVSDIGDAMSASDMVSTDGTTSQDSTAPTDGHSSSDDVNANANQPKTFVQQLEEQLASKRNRLPESCYAEDVYSPEDNTKLPEGCKTIMDFLNIPKNFDFKSMVDLALQDADTVESLNSDNTNVLQKVENPVYTGKYPDSLGDYIFYPTIHKRRYSTSNGEPEAANLEEVFDHLKGKKVHELMPPETATPVEKIKKSDFMFDSYDYIKHYLNHLNQYNYRVISSHHKNDDRLNHYLNNEYIQRIQKKFPPEADHTLRIREYFMSLLPEVMDNLVNLIKNDPNKDRIPSPPLHDMSLAPGFTLPDYMRPDYTMDDVRTGGYQEADFVKYSSLKGLHEPEKHLHYPYADTEPLYQRQLLSTYLDIVKTGELGEPETYKKYKSHAASIRNEMYTDQTKLPQEIYGETDEIKSDKKPLTIEKTTTLTKVYERGSRKCSVALVYLEPGNGHIIINNRDGYQYVRYCTERIREILEPIDVLYAYKKFNVVAVAHGGGISGQSGAIRHALARYITRVLSPKLEPYLSLRNLTKADTRQVERKKTNLRKARKKEHYSKR
ncbi:putative ribosomal protein S9 [Babesia divergens]|uniref:Ribosomal protein S9 n=1 Tax=Babesia divergens TaxID=32595 RepID=A0AAD9LES4_BABDI|nr:putative ribosomal protein S9 [Babesia divergens]